MLKCFILVMCIMNEVCNFKASVICVESFQTTLHKEYRISYFGHYKNVDATVVPSNGTTQSFKVNSI